MPTDSSTPRPAVSAVAGGVDAAAHRPYVDAVVAAIEAAGIGVEGYDVEWPSIDAVRVGSIRIDQASAGVLPGHQALMLMWDDQLGWRLGVFYHNGKGGYSWLLPVPLVATPDEVVTALLTARSGARLPEVPDEVPPARDSVAVARFEAALAAYHTDPTPHAQQAQSGQIDAPHDA
jgi:hypothetical protein